MGAAPHAADGQMCQGSAALLYRGKERKKKKKTSAMARSSKMASCLLKKHQVQISRDISQG